MTLFQQDIWARADTGPIVATKDFDSKVIFRSTQELVKKYDIKFDPESVVPTDDGLIDRLWQAGVELLVDVGVLCLDTNRVIKFTEQEILDTIRFAPRQVVLGEGKDAVVMAHRGIEDERLPVIVGGPIGCLVSEDIAPRVYEAYAREPSVDVLIGGTIGEIGGLQVKSGSPVELYAEQAVLAWQRDALRRAGRPGLPIMGSMAASALAAVGAVSEEWGYRKSDLLHAHIDVNLKTNYDYMCRAELQHHYGGLLWGCGSPGIGGSFGGVEGTAVGAVAEALASYMINRVDIVGVYTLDYSGPMGISTTKTLWGTSLANAAMARHSNLIVCHGAPGGTAAGPCTEMYLYEIAASTVAAMVTGANFTNCVGSDGIPADTFGGPLDIRFCRDVACAAARLDREKANEIVKAIMARFEDKVVAGTAPAGKTFQECNDLDSLRPTKEYLDLCDYVKQELRGLGLEVK